MGKGKWITTSLVAQQSISKIVEQLQLTTGLFAIRQIVIIGILGNILLTYLGEVYTGASWDTK